VLTLGGYRRIPLQQSFAPEIGPDRDGLSMAEVDPLLNGHGVACVDDDALGACDFGMSGDKFARQAECRQP
jgi:hypothetical protein